MGDHDCRDPDGGAPRAHRGLRLRAAQAPHRDRLRPGYRARGSDLRALGEEAPRGHPSGVLRDRSWTRRSDSRSHRHLARQRRADRKVPIPRTPGQRRQRVVSSRTRRGSPLSRIGGLRRRKHRSARRRVSAGGSSRREDGRAIARASDSRSWSRAESSFYKHPRFPRSPRLAAWRGRSPGPPGAKSPTS